MRLIARRTAALVAVPALTLAGLVATTAPASAATDPAPATAAGTWLTGQLQDTGWIAHSQQYDFDDYGLTIDVALALDAAGADASAVSDISDAVAAHIDDYTRPVAYGTDLSAGGSAKALVLAQAAGDDPTSYGGRDLVADLKSTVATEGANAGRIQDDWDPSNQYAADYANVLGQAFAAQGLDAAGSDSTDAVTDFLLQQQCSAGYFRQDFSAADAPDQSCDAGAGKPNVDATAVAVQALQGQLDDSDVAAHVTKAVDWLVAHQRGNGSFGSNADIAGNANSTGAAAYALLLSGEDDAAAKAAAWLRAHQATNVANCVYYDSADTGAVLYDNAARTTAQAGPMDAALTDQSLRATAQALPGLLAAQAGPGSPNVLFAPGYVKAGGTTEVGVNDAAPGEALCAMLGEQSVLGWANPAGEAGLKVRVPAKAGKSRVTVANAGGDFGDAEIDALGAKKLTVSLKGKRVPAGKRQVITVKGLAPGEDAQVEVDWPAGRHGASGEGTGGQANRHGVFRATFTVPGKHLGKATVKAAGEFRNRKGSTSFRVTR